MGESWSNAAADYKKGGERDNQLDLRHLTSLLVETDSSQFDDFECRNLLDAGRAGYRHGFAQLSLGLEATANVICTRNLIWADTVIFGTTLKDLGLGPNERLGMMVID